MAGGGKLKVKVVNGRDLQNKESFQTSDPYVKLEIGEENYKTKHVSSNLNPDWGEEFTFEIKTKTNTGVIALSVWDKNTIKKDAFMGYTFVTYDDCKKDQDTEKKALMLGDCKGEVNLVITPDFETSATKIEKMYVQINQVEDDGLKTKLQNEVNELTKVKDQLTTDFNKLKKDFEKLEDDANVLQDEKNKLLHENNQSKKDVEEIKVANISLLDKEKELINEIAVLKSELENQKKENEDRNSVKEDDFQSLHEEKSRLSNENDKLKLDIKQHMNEIGRLEKEVQMLKIAAEDSIVVEEVSEQLETGISIDDLVDKNDDFYQRLLAEYSNIYNFKVNLLEELMGFQTIQELIFMKLNENINEVKKNPGNISQLREELRQNIMGFDKVQELIFNKFNGKVKPLDLSELKKIIDELKSGSSDNLDNAIAFTLT